MTDELSILIVNYNTKDLTCACLRSVLSQKINMPVEILVLDNASTDGSADAIRNEFPAVNLFVSKENIGFGKGNNMLAKKARGNYLLLLNTDTVVTEGALERLVNCYKKHAKEVGFMGPKLLNPDMTPQASAGRFPTLPVVFAWLLLRGDYWGITRSSPSRFSQVDWVSGACIVTLKSHYKALKGFDENIFMYMEEVDLLYRARKSGLRTAFCPEPCVIHYGSASSQGKTEPILQVFRGLKYFYKKHYGPVDLFLLRRVLQLKAFIGYCAGVIGGNSYLKKTYGKALKIA